MNYNLLKGKRGIIFGALNEQSIAWKVAEKAVENGAIITLSNTPVAVRMGETKALAEKLNCEVIPADATSKRIQAFHGSVGRTNRFRASLYRYVTERSQASHLR